LRVSCDPKGIRIAVRTIKNGGIVVFPTDTVYGIGCDPYNSKAVKRIYKIKKRNFAKTFPVLGASMREISKIAFFDKKSEKIARKFWPGQITLILRVKDEKLIKSMNLKGKIAVRVPKSKSTVLLLKKCGFLIGTSANLSGKSSCTNLKDCQNSIQGYDLAIDGGSLRCKGESTIVEVNKDKVRILREGAIDKKDIFDLF